MRRIAIITIVVGGVGAAIAGVWSRDEPSAVNTPAARRAGALPMARATTPVQIGDEHSYDVSLEQTARVGSGDELAVRIDGEWAVAYAGEDGRGRVFRAQLRDVRPVVQSGNQAITMSSPGLARPYFFTTATSGRVIALHFAADVDATMRGALTALATAFQVSPGSAGTWDVVESDSLGDYDARYVATSRGLHRQRLRYRDTPVEVQVVASGTDIVLRSDGWPDQTTGHEVTRLGIDTLSAMVEAKVSLRHRAHARVDAGWYDGLELTAPNALTSAADFARLDHDLVDGATLPDLLAELARVSDDTHASGHQFLRIAALLRLDEGAVREAERAVLAGQATSSVLVAALGEAGTPVAQRALANVLASPLPDETRTHAAVALGVTERPTRDTLTALAHASGTSGDVAATATLAQGNAALRIRNDDPGAADRAIDDLLARLANASDDHERALCLRALGNTGDARIVHAVESALASSNVLVRVAATEALRLVPGADGLIAGRLSDTAVPVRIAAVFSASHRDLAPYLASLFDTVRRDPDAEVRRSIVELAGARRNEHQTLHDILAHAAQRDRDPEIRALAIKLLPT